VPSFKLKEALKYAKKILKQSISVGGDSMSDFRNIEGRSGQYQNSHKCYKLEGSVCQKTSCDAILEKKEVGGRVARYCPQHQKIYK
jgi:formamidopyrimidine-DNA glycosylase